MRDSVAPQAESGLLGERAERTTNGSSAVGLLAYLHDATLSSLHTHVLSTGQDNDGRPYAILADTVLYPAGGGQPADRGVIEWTGPQGLPVLVDVVDVQRINGEVRHYFADLDSNEAKRSTAEGVDVDAPPPQQRGDQIPHSAACRLELDWERRFDHMQQHTAQHLLTAVAADRFGWPTTSFHLGPDVSDIELDVPRLSLAQLDALEEAVAMEIRAARNVLVRQVNPDSLAGTSVRTRGLPEGHVGPIRIIEIDGVDACACGGTHVANTAEVESLKLLGTEPMRGGTRLHFVAGSRVRSRLRGHEARMGHLRSSLGVPDDEIVGAVESRLERTSDLLRRLADTEKQLAAVLAEQHATDPAAVTVARIDAALVAPLAQAYSRLAGKALLLAVALESPGPFSLARGQGSALNVQVAGHTVAQIFDGRGGGSGSLYQGKGDRLDRIDEAVAAIASTAEGAVGGPGDVGVRR